MKQFYPLFLLSFIFIFVEAKPPKKYIDNGVAVNQKYVSYILHSTMPDSLQMLYLGCNNLFFKYKNEQFMFDPFFSNPSLVEVGLGKIKFNEKSIALGLERIKNAGFDLSKVKHLFITHGHYDHVFDLPYLLSHKFYHDSLKIHCNQTVQTELYKYTHTTKFITNKYPPCDTNVYDKNLWQYVSSNIRVMPLLSSHAPHIMGIEFMQGNAKKKTFSKYDTATFKSNAKQWKVGEDFAYLIDIIENDTPVFRILIQGPSVKPCADIFPDVILKEKAVDVAMMVVASNQFIDNYPTHQLSRLKPQKVILIHWENFFRDYTKEAELVPYTNFDKFFIKAKNAQSKYWNYSNDSNMFVMPFPGTKIVFKKD